MPRLVLLVTGGLGLAVVARAAALYRGSDPLAFALVLVILAGLLVGLGELWMRSSRVHRLGRDLASLPRPATPEALEEAKEPLRAMLKARAAGVSFSIQGASLATYLLGMLIMLGMLGTFLGLFESLRGAREALSAGEDVAALRSGLGAPLAGLSRAFGTSATGVSASALLGLALVFTRKEEARFARELAAYATGPLLPATVQGRSLVALEAVAESTLALPETAEAMQAALVEIRELGTQIAQERESAAEQLVSLTKALTTEIRASLATMANEVGASLSATATEVGGSLGQATAELRASLETTAKLVHGSLEALGDKAASSMGETSQAHIEASKRATAANHESLRALSEEVVASLRSASQEASASLLRASEETCSSLRAASLTTSTSLREIHAKTLESFEKLGPELGSTLHHVAEGSQSALASLGAETSTTLRALAEETASALRETSQEQLEASRSQMALAKEALAEALEEVHRASSEQQTALLSSIKGAAEEASFALREASEAVRSDLSGALTESKERALSALAPLVEQLTERAGEVMQAQLSPWLERMDRDAEARARQSTEISERLGALVASSLEGAKEVHEAVRAQLGELRQLASEVREQSQALTTASEARILEVAEQTRLVLDRQLEAHVELDARISKVQAELGGALVEKIEAHAGEIRETTASTASLAKEAAELLRLGSAEMAAAAELLTGAIDRHREASERWLDGVSLGGGGEPSGMGEVLDDSLERTREALAHVVELQREMITEVRQLRETPAEAAEG